MSYTADEADLLATFNPDDWMVPPWQGVDDGPVRPRLPYREFPGPHGESAHCGQFKLLMSEIEFLGAWLKRSGSRRNGPTKVVYVGAADGTHFPVIDNLFRDSKGVPLFHYVLIDPGKFSKQLVRHVAQNPHITLINEYFTEEMAETMDPCLFISDARRATEDEEVNSTLKVEDHDLQLRWLRSLPVVWAAMLKFSLPYTAGTTHYPAGWLRYQVFAPLHSTEMRLILMPEHLRYEDGRLFWEDRVYNHTEIEEVLFARNIVRHRRLPAPTNMAIVETLMNFFGGISVDVLLTLRIWHDAYPGTELQRQVKLTWVLGEFRKVYGQSIAQRRLRQR